MEYRNSFRFIKDKYLYSILLVIAGVVLWQVLVVRFSVPAYILPSPLAVAFAFKKYRFVLLAHMQVTLLEVVAGLVAGAAIGFLSAVFIFCYKILYRTLYPLVICLQSVPKMVLAPLFIIWFGFGIAPKIAITALITLFPVLVNTLRGLTFVQPELIDLMKSLRASKMQILFKVRLPSALPHFFTGVRISIALAVVGAIVAEFVGADKGLGYLIMLSNIELNTSLMFAIFILLGLLGLVLTGAVLVMERIFVRWHIKANKGAIR